jgi:hypothetical protein
MMMRADGEKAKIAVDNVDDDIDDVLSELAAVTKECCVSIAAATWTREYDEDEDDDDDDTTSNPGEILQEICVASRTSSRSNSLSPIFHIRYYVAYFGQCGVFELGGTAIGRYTSTSNRYRPPRG